MAREREAINNLVSKNDKRRECVRSSIVRREDEQENKKGGKEKKNYKKCVEGAS